MVSVIAGCAAVVPDEGEGGSSLPSPRPLARAPAASAREGPGRLDAEGGPGTSVAWTSPPGRSGNAGVTSRTMGRAGPGMFKRPAGATVVDATVTGGVADVVDRVVGHRRDDGGAPVPELAHVPGEQHRVLAGGVDVENALDGGVKVRGLLGECVAGVFVERALHAHAVTPGDEVGVRLRAPGLDALGLAAAQRIAPGGLLDALGARLQGEGVVDRNEVRTRDRVRDRQRHGMGQWVRRRGGRFGARHRGHRRYRHRGRGSGGVHPVRASQERSADGRAAPRHGEGGGSSRMRPSVSIPRQSTSSMAAATAGSDRAMALSRQRSSSTARHRVADQSSASVPPS